MIADFVFALLQPQPALARVHSPQIAQAQIAGECRQLQRLERIYSDADLGSPAIRDIRRAAIVTLAGEVNQPSAGWIQISSPVEGYILATFLAPCGSVDSQLQPLAPPLPNLPIPLPPARVPSQIYIPPASSLQLPNSPSQLQLPNPPSQLRLPLRSPVPPPPDRSEP